jgi:hypothetical protein
MQVYYNAFTSLLDTILENIAIGNEYRGSMAGMICCPVKAVLWMQAVKGLINEFLIKECIWLLETISKETYISHP